MIDLNYIECAGVRVPSDWSVDQLREALVKRNIRFSRVNEKEIMAVFVAAIQLKSQLENNIHELQAEVAKWDRYVKERKAAIRCPGCGTQWTEPPAAKSPDTKLTRKHNKENKKQ